MSSPRTQLIVDLAVPYLLQLNGTRRRRCKTNREGIFWWKKWTYSTWPLHRLDLYYVSEIRGNSVWRKVLRTNFLAGSGGQIDEETATRGDSGRVRREEPPRPA
jgi:hypothetical protein